MRISSGGNKLSDDYINVLPSFSDNPQVSDFERLKPILSYQEYLQKYSLVSDYTISKSDPSAIEAVNKLVSDYNDDLERIKREKDAKTVIFFVRNFKELVRGKKEKLKRDYFNVLSGVFKCLYSKSEDKFNELDKVRLYKEYVRRDPNYKEDMDDSDPDAVEEIERLVTRFNNDLPRIKAERDQQAVENFLKEFRLLLEGKE